MAFILVDGNTQFDRQTVKIDIQVIVILSGISQSVEPIPDRHVESISETIKTQNPNGRIKKNAPFGFQLGLGGRPGARPNNGRAHIVGHHTVIKCP
jgi:hypothetical protein